MLGLLTAAAEIVVPTFVVAEYRDAKDNSVVLMMNDVFRVLRLVRKEI